jgi:hypothetical protein
MSLQEKSNLARLMATENLYIEERSVPTAMFDMKNRVLTVPILDGNISNNIYDLFMGHEVGHALETPAEGYHNSIKVLGVNRTILNVCEDVRIEKKIKRKFPGIRYPFIKGYEELLKRNFFGIKGVDLNTLNLIDRINLHTKCGATLAISFNEEENKLLSELESVETFKEVVAVAKKIQKYMKEQKEQPKEEKQQQKAESDGQYGDSEPSDDNEESDSDELNDGENEEEPEPQKPVKKPEEEIESITDKNFRKNESKLFEQKHKETVYCNIPEVNSDKFIVEYSKIMTLIKQHNTDESKIDALNDFKKFRRESDPVVSYLIKEFELRKNAEQQLKVRVSKTGDINTNRIHEYQFSDDIFKRLMSMPNGKSHGLVMLIDWSGSMANYINQTIRQLLNIVMFCRKANIPHEVYAFSDGFGDSRIKTEEKVGDIHFSQASNVRLLNLFSSRMKNAEFTTLASYLLEFQQVNVHIPGVRKNDFSFPRKLSLNGTPLNESLILSFDLVEKFKQRTRADIVNMIVLSDGDGHNINFIKGVYVPRNSHIDKIVIRDPKTKNYIDMMKIMPHMTSQNAARQRDALVYLLRQRTNSNVLCFHITAAGNAREKLREFLPAKTAAERNNRFFTDPELEKMHENFRKQKYYIAKTKYGFSEYYLIRSSNLELEEEDFADKEIKSKSLVSAFSKYTSSKVQSRVVLNSFIRMIA